MLLSASVAFLKLITLFYFSSCVIVMDIRTLICLLCLPYVAFGYLDKMYNVKQQTANDTRYLGGLFDFDTCGTDGCGIPNLSHKIVGGEVTLKNEFPWMVGLHETSNYLFAGAKLSQFCGGTLISRSWVITAAHCTERMKDSPWKLLVSIGRHDLSDGQLTDAGIIAPRVAWKIVVHPKYSVKTSDYDISLVMLLWRVPWTMTVRPICFPSADPDLTSKSGIAIGWGALTEGGPGSSLLMEVSIPLITNEVCQRAYTGDRVTITSRMLCAAVHDGGKDSCQGDSGGPLMLQCSDRYLLIGVVSFGIGCGEDNHPGVYARVTKFREWIYSLVGERDVCRNICNS